MNARHVLNLLTSIVAVASCLGSASAQQVTGVAGPELGADKHTTVFDYKPDGPGPGKGGTGILSVDGKEVARNSVEHTTPITFPEDQTFDIGQDTRTPLAMIEYRYDTPFRFTGKINKVTFNLDEEKLTAEEQEVVHKALARARDEL